MVSVKEKAWQRSVSGVAFGVTATRAFVAVGYPSVSFFEFD